MKRSSAIFRHGLCAFFVLFLLLGQTVLAADFSKLVILHTNDSHGFDRSEAKHIGMPVISQIKKDMQAKDYNVLLLDAGDIIQGNDLAEIDHGKSIIGYMNALGYDAATLGNHEFEYGQDVLKDRMKEAKFPFVSSNILYESTGNLFIQPVVVLDKPYGKIGIIGLTTPVTPTSSKPSNVSGLNFLEKDVLYANTQMYVNQLQAAGCDLIIALGHIGSEAPLIGNRSEDILNHVNGIDIFIDGHDHLVKNDYVGKTLRAEAGCYTENLGCIVFENGQWQEKLIACGQYTKSDAMVDKMIKATEKEIEQQYGAIIGVSKVNLDTSRMPGLRNQEMNSGDFCTDAFFWQANQYKGHDYKLDGVIVNGGDIRAGISPGKVTVKDITAMMPFKNPLYIVQIKGSKLLELLEAGTQISPEEMGAFPQVAGIEYTLDTTVPYTRGQQYPKSFYFAPAKPGSRVHIKSVGGKKFDTNAVYAICISKFLVEGGDSYGGLLEKDALISAEQIGYTETESVINYITKGMGGVIGENYKDVKSRIVITP